MIPNWIVDAILAILFVGNLLIVLFLWPAWTNLVALVFILAAWILIRILK